jgi:hypothetical protein
VAKLKAVPAFNAQVRRALGDLILELAREHNQGQLEGVLLLVKRRGEAVEARRAGLKDSDALWALEGAKLTMLLERC